MSSHDTSHIVDTRWIYACRTDQLVPGFGVTVLLPDEEQAALFWCNNQYYAINNIDPFGHAAVLARGLVGDRSGTICVFSPLLKQAFALETGICLDDPAVKLMTYPVKIQDDKVYVGV